MAIKYNENMNLCAYKSYYKNDFNHSKRLKEAFGTFNYQGCDYINSNGAKIEFKECLTAKQRKMVRFAIYLKDYLESEYIVCIWWKNYKNNQKEIYVHRSKYILKKYKFANKRQICQPYISTIGKNYLAKFKSLDNLKEYLDKLQPNELCEGVDCLDCSELSTCKKHKIDLSKLGNIK
jgi:hypothetical protein